MRLFLGIVPGILPWLEEPEIYDKMTEKKAGIGFSFWSYRRYHEDIIAKGIHDYFAFDGPIMLDSGAYTAFNKGFDIKLEEYDTFLSKIDIGENDLVVNLDVVGNTKKSKDNWVILSNKHEFPILPVIHYSERFNCYESEKYIGLGGMVPAFKINQEGSAYSVASWITEMNHRWNKRFHGFGIGSPYHQILFQNCLFSVDWIGWRRNAAVCSCYTPEGSVYIHEARKKKKKGKTLTLNMFELYKPPFIQSYEVLHKKGSEGWLFRALWNVWWFLIAQDYKKEIEKSKYIISLRKHILDVISKIKSQPLDIFFNK